MSFNGRVFLLYYMTTCVCASTGSCRDNQVNQPAGDGHIYSTWLIHSEQQKHHIGALVCGLTRLKPGLIFFSILEYVWWGRGQKEVSQDMDGGGQDSEPVGMPGPPLGSAGGSCWRPPEHLLQQTVGPSVGSSWTVHCGIQTLSHSSPQSCRVWSGLCSHTPAHCSLRQTTSSLWRKVKKEGLMADN